MKTILLALVISPCLLAQTPTVITGNLLDASGQPANCTILAHKLNVAGVSETVIGYVVIGGAMVSPSGYGYSTSPGGISRAGAFQLSPGLYNVASNCGGLFGAGTHRWNVPPANGLTFPITQLINGQGRSLTQWTYSLTNMQGSISSQ